MSDQDAEESDHDGPETLAEQFGQLNRHLREVFEIAIAEPMRPFLDLATALTALAGLVAFAGVGHLIAGDVGAAVLIYVFVGILYVSGSLEARDLI